jgi:hypothetical protein
MPFVQVHFYQLGILSTTISPTCPFSNYHFAKCHLVKYPFVGILSTTILLNAICSCTLLLAFYQQPFYQLALSSTTTLIKCYFVKYHFINWHFVNYHYKTNLFANHHAVKSHLIKGTFVNLTFCQLPFSVSSAIIVKFKLGFIEVKCSEHLAKWRVDKM